MCSWLDTETKALLEQSPPTKLAPPDTAGFTLVLISVCHRDGQRLIRALRRILQISGGDARKRLARELPIVVDHGLSHSEALLAQFELISCDAISVFIADEVAAGATQEYLTSLYDTLLHSDEFRETPVRIEAIPRNERGEKFIDQFLGAQTLSLPAELKVLYKKARIMKHWANRIGARVTVVHV